MRKRKARYEDYGITDDEVEYVMDFCQNANDKEKNFIKQALSTLDPYISPYIYNSLVDKKSYEKICEKDYLYIGKDDFYGYRRYGVYCIKDWMIINRIWKYDE